MSYNQWSGQGQNKGWDNKQGFIPPQNQGFIPSQNQGWNNQGSGQGWNNQGSSQGWNNQGLNDQGYNQNFNPIPQSNWNNQSYSSTVKFTYSGDQSIHVTSRCDGCSITPIVGKRYKCAECKDFDYCEQCYFYNKQKHSHVFTEKIIKKFHIGVTCDGCGISCIIGTRFKCNTCYNLDLCQSCYKSNLNIHNHAFTQID
jgi:hypothetical protein